MIKLLRLDERMIHGQVAIKWSRHLDVDRIIVANDGASQNQIIQHSLLMAAPSTCKTAIKSVDGAIKLINDPRALNLKILVIVATPKDLLKVLKETSGINDINIGNYGRIAEKHGEELRKTYRPNLYLYDDEKEVLEEVLKLGINTVYQTIPDDTPEKLEKVLG